MQSLVYENVTFDTIGIFTAAALKYGFLTG